MAGEHDLYYVVLHKRKEPPYPRHAIGLCGSFAQAKDEKPKKQGVNVQLENEAAGQTSKSAFAPIFKDIVTAIEVYRSLDETVALLRRDGSELNIRIHFDPVLDKYARKKEHEDEERMIFSFDRTHAPDMLSGLARTTRGMKGLRQLPRLLLIGLVSEYDVFLSELIRAVIEKRPQSLAGSEKVEASRLLDFSSLDEAREYLIDREIETIMVRNDHLDQLKELSRLSGATVDVEDDVVRRFLEICETTKLVCPHRWNSQQQIHQEMQSPQDRVGGGNKGQFRDTA